MKKMVGWLDDDIPFNNLIDMMYSCWGAQRSAHDAAVGQVERLLAGKITCSFERRHPISAISER